MLKRGNPFTPEPLADKKKLREYASPARTPLRNVVSAKPAAESPQTPLNDDENERKASRAAIADTKRRMKRELLSPASTTARANPPKLMGAKGVPSPLTPSAIRAELATKPLAVPKLTGEQRNKMFEEWMKIAADNKINAKNSWNVALIDYFSELTFLRDGDSINFQRASCTLDGCVKIYSTRVDSCADETGKLLNGLAEGGKKSKWGTDFLAESSEAIDGKEESDRKPASSKRSHRAVDTLERSFEALNLKYFEVEFSADPLFKKMCAEFDESGSGGFLTYSLSLGANGQLIFDSNDAAPIDEAIQHADNGDDDGTTTDIGGLVGNFVGLESKSVLPSLANYSFGNSDLSKMDRSLSETLARLAATNKMEVDDSEDEEDLHENDVPDLGNFYEAAPLDDGMYDEYNEAPAPAQDWALQPAHGGHRQMVGEEGERTTVEAGLTDSFLAYFDSKMNRNWAGPEHWKIQRPHLRRTPVEARPRTAKKEFSLDFEAEPVDVAQLFAKANPVAITLSKSALDERNEKDNLLPEDLHFSSSELLRLFVKPSWTIGKRAVRQIVGAVPNEEGARPDLMPQELAVDYWADPRNLEAQGMEGAAADDHAPLNHDDGYYYDNDLPMPDPLDAALPGHALGDDLVPTSRAVAAGAINYDRRAKKVDVQELKRVLWQEISSPATGPKPASFTTLMKEAQQNTSMPAEMRQDVSVPYYFICLLHLANEHNLELASDSHDLVVSRTSQ